MADAVVTGPMVGTPFSLSVLMLVLMCLKRKAREKKEKRTRSVWHSSCK